MAQKRSWDRLWDSANPAQNKIVDLAQTYGATRMILFGSALEGPEQTRDVDLACGSVTGWKLYELGARLEEILHRPLDLISLSPPNPFTRLVEARGRAILCDSSL